MTLIRPATTPTDLDTVRQLCWDYRTHLSHVSPIDAELVKTFYPTPKYTALMDGLAQAHARPTGIILLAEHSDKPAGCVMTHALDDTSSEIKRLFVTPQARGHGIARKLVTACMDQARSDGFTRILLDTSVTLEPARALYANMSFTERGPYQDIPSGVLQHLVFFEAQL